METTDLPEDILTEGYRIITNFGGLQAIQDTNWQDILSSLKINLEDKGRSESVKSGLIAFVMRQDSVNTENTNNVNLEDYETAESLGEESPEKMELSQGKVEQTVQGMGYSEMGDVIQSQAFEVTQPNLLSQSLTLNEFDNLESNTGNDELISHRKKKEDYFSLSPTLDAAKENKGPVKEDVNFEIIGYRRNEQDDTILYNVQQIDSMENLDVSEDLLKHKCPRLLQAFWREVAAPSEPKNRGIQNIHENQKVSTILTASAEKKPGNRSRRDNSLQRLDLNRFDRAGRRRRNKLSKDFQDELVISSESEDEVLRSTKKLHANTTESSVETTKLSNVKSPKGKSSFINRNNDTEDYDFRIIGIKSNENGSDLLYSVKSQDSNVKILVPAAVMEKKCPDLVFQFLKNNYLLPLCNEHNA